MKHVQRRRSGFQPRGHDSINSNLTREPVRMLYDRHGWGGTIQRTGLGSMAGDVQGSEFHGRMEGDLEKRKVRCNADWLHRNLPGGQDGTKEERNEASGRHKPLDSGRLVPSVQPAFADLRRGERQNAECRMQVQDGRRALRSFQHRWASSDRAAQEWRSGRGPLQGASSPPGVVPNATLRLPAAREGVQRRLSQPVSLVPPPPIISVNAQVPSAGCR
ncbi:hypothetical protein L207DRAFT_594836 [Hyaloscypha variabilis F]|uniref:Uncharacterized protein n=1 Tax=Hyaloscypha variabilis (strain UAMH 11265 / GT02V1 / F) TaxID=1149755 RepID=A0A2J6SCK6_HYAVF|nr:hypothetical protein L207DRAFT_594836 [Hyaloscypha variabilis F]